MLVYWTIYTDIGEINEGNSEGFLFRFGIGLKDAIFAGTFLYAVVIFMSRKKFFSVNMIFAIIGLVILLLPALLHEYLEFLRLLRRMKGEYA